VATRTGGSARSVATAAKTTSEPMARLRRSLQHCAQPDCSAQAAGRL